MFRHTKCSVCMYVEMYVYEMYVCMYVYEMYVLRMYVIGVMQAITVSLNYTLASPVSTAVSLQFLR